MKLVLIIILFFSYFLQFTISIYISSRSKIYDDIRFYMIIIIISFVSIITVLTIYYTCYLKFFLDKNFIIRKNNNINISVIDNSHFFLNSSSITRIENINQNDNYNVQDFLKEMFEKKNIDLVEKNILNKDNDFDNINHDDIIYFHNEYFFLDINNDDYIEKNIINSKKNINKRNIINYLDNDLEINTERKLIKKEKIIDIQKKKEQNLKNIQLEKKDIENLKKIFNHSYFILFSTISVLIISVTLNLIVSNNHKLYFILLYLLFAFELTGNFAIYHLFVKDIKNQEYKNLKMISNLENITNKSHKKKIKFDFIKQLSIHNRLNHLLNLYDE